MSNIFDIIGKENIIISSDSLYTYRQTALGELGDIPTLKTEQYRKIDIKAIFERSFNKSAIASGAFEFNKTYCGGVLTCDIGRFSTEHTDIFQRYFSKALSGAIEQSIGTEFKNRAHERSFMVDLNSSFLDCGTVVYVPKNTNIEEPIEFQITHENIVLGRRDIIIVDKFSKATIIIDNISSHTLLNRVCEIYLEPNAYLELVEVNMSNNAENTINNIAVMQSEGSTFKHYSVTATDKTQRSNIKVMLNGSGAKGQLYGANMLFGKAEVSVNTVMEHNVEHCSSDEHYKNIVADSAISDFTGIIFVNNDAQKTDANQRNDNIVLTTEAKAFSKPQLEIYADDVKCTHGATVGQLSEDSLFYMMQRGISQEKAQKLLLTGYIGDVLMSIENEQLRNKLIDMISDVVLSVK